MEPNPVNPVLETQEEYIKFYNKYKALIDYLVL